MRELKLALAKAREALEAVRRHLTAAAEARDDAAARQALAAAQEELSRALVARRLGDEIEPARIDDLRLAARAREDDLAAAELVGAEIARRGGADLELLDALGGSLVAELRKVAEPEIERLHAELVRVLRPLVERAFALRSLSPAVGGEPALRLDAIAHAGSFVGIGEVAPGKLAPELEAARAALADLESARGSLREAISDAHQRAVQATRGGRPFGGSFA